MRTSEQTKEIARETLNNPMKSREEKEVAARVLGLARWGEEYTQDEEAAPEEPQEEKPAERLIREEAEKAIESLKG